MDMTVQMSDVMAWKMERDGLRCCAWLNMKYEVGAGGRSDGSILAIPTLNQVIFYLNWNILHGSLLVSGTALNNIPLAGYIIVSFSSWITQITQSPQQTIVCVHKPKNVLLLPRNGRDMHAISNTIPMSKSLWGFLRTSWQIVVEVMELPAASINWLCPSHTKTANMQMLSWTRQS